MKNLTLATTFVVLAATFASPGIAADRDARQTAQAVAEITFVNKTKKSSAYLSPAIYRTDASANAQRSENLLIDVSGRHFKKKFFKRKSFGSHRRGFGHRSFGHRGFGHRSFGHGGFGHRNFGHNAFDHGRNGFKGHHSDGGKLKKKKFLGKLLFGF